MSRFDLHTHTKYCDGKDTPRDMIEGAIAMGLSAIGFTAHAYTDFDESYCMKKEDEKRYLAELSALREEYRDKIGVYIGFEVDAFGKKPAGDYDYVIGSLHYVFANGVYYGVDESIDVTRRAIEEGFGGDADAYAEAYYEALPRVLLHDPAIIGHFDLLTKFNEREALVDTASLRYIAAWQRAADELLLANIPFEINTGAISRGYRTIPYPAGDIIRYLAERGARFVLSGDAHAKESLCFAFDDVEKLLSEYGLVQGDDGYFKKCS